MTVNCIAGRGTGTRGESRESVPERRRERTCLCGPYVIALFASLLCYFAWRRPCRPRTRALGRGSGLSFLALPRPRRYLLYMRFTTVSTRQTSRQTSSTRSRWARFMVAPARRTRRRAFRCLGPCRGRRIRAAPGPARRPRVVRRWSPGVRRPPPDKRPSNVK
jgi:hypothetical protein